MIKKYFFFPLLILLTSACSMYHVTSEDIADNYYPSKKSALDIIILENVTKPHEVIGIITVNAERRQKIEEVIAKLKREAAILGADAITDLQSDSTGQWKKLPVQAALGNAYVRANFSAVAVAFK